MFIISAEVYAFGLLMYLILGSGKEQPWANGWPPPSPKWNSDSSLGDGPAAVRRNVQVETPPLSYGHEKTKLAHPTAVDYGSV